MWEDGLYWDQKPVSCKRFQAWKQETLVTCSSCLLCWLKLVKCCDNMYQKTKSNQLANWKGLVFFTKKTMRWKYNSITSCICCLVLYRGRILGQNPDKSLKSFPPCYSQSPLQLCLEISISSNSHNLLQLLKLSSVTVCRKEERRKPEPVP